MTIPKRGGWRNPASAANGTRGGRPRKPTMRVDIDLDTAALAQRLMLREWPGVSNVEQLFSYALRRLAEMTDD